MYRDPGEKLLTVIADTLAVIYGITPEWSEKGRQLRASAKGYVPPPKPRRLTVRNGVREALDETPATTRNAGEFEMLARLWQ